MNWFEILKVLGTKTGFSQLDFDNVVIEDEDDCLKRLKELNRKIHQYCESKSKDTEMGMRKNPKARITSYDIGKTVLTVNDEVPEFTEEVACEILEFIKNIKTAETRGSKSKEYYFSILRNKMQGVSVTQLYFGEGTKEAYVIYLNGEADELEGWLSGLV